MGIKLLLLDLDGTTLASDQIHVSQRNQDAIRAAMEKGVEVVPCTGRVLDMFPPELKRIGAYKYCISSHGARVVGNSASDSFYENVICPEDAVKILSLLEGKKLYCEIAANNTIYMEKAIYSNWKSYPAPAHHVWYLEAAIPKAVEKPSEYFRKNHIGIEKINIYGIPEIFQEYLYRILTSTAAIRHTRDGAGPDLEFQTKTLDKTKAVDCLLNQLNYTYDDIMMIGDSTSDLDIIKKARIGVAMGNAPARIKKEADYVTDSNEEDGVAKAIERWILNVNE